MMNTERLIRHAVQEKLNIILCINKVRRLFSFSFINGNSLRLTLLSAAITVGAHAQQGYCSLSVCLFVDA